MFVRKVMLTIFKVFFKIFFPSLSFIVVVGVVVIVVVVGCSRATCAPSVSPQLPAKCRRKN